MDLKANKAKTAYLILADGTVFTGKSFGCEGEVVGEIVFTTAMTGYEETLTDPSYCGQIVTQTFPLIGNDHAVHNTCFTDYSCKPSCIYAEQSDDVVLFQKAVYVAFTAEV